MKLFILIILFLAGSFAGDNFLGKNNFDIGEIPSIPNIEIPNIEIPNIEIPNIEIPSMEFPNIETSLSAFQNAMNSYVPNWGEEIEDQAPMTTWGSEEAVIPTAQEESTPVAAESVVVPIPTFEEQMEQQEQIESVVESSYPYEESAVPVQEQEEAQVVQQSSVVKSASYSASTSGYQECSQLQIAYTPTIQSCLNYGAQQISAIGEKSGSFTSKNVKISQVNSVYQKITSNGINYLCDVTLSSGSSFSVTTTYTVFYSFFSQATTMASYSYQVNWYSSSSSSSSTSTSSSSGSSSSSTSTSSTSSGSSSNYITMSSGEIQQDQSCLSAIQYGMNQIIQVASSAGKITSTSGYQVSKISKIQKKTVSNGCYYKCDVTFQQSTTQISSSYVVFVSSSSSMSFSKYTYKVSQASSSSSSSTSNSGSTSTSTSTNSSSYVTMTKEQIQQDQGCQNALQYGMSQIVQKAASTSEITSTSGYQISQINKVEKMSNSNGTSYQCNVVIQQSSTLQISASYVVFVSQTSSSYMSFSSYSYQVYYSSSSSESSSSSLSNSG